MVRHERDVFVLNLIYVAVDLSNEIRRKIHYISKDLGKCLGTTHLVAWMWQKYIQDDWFPGICPCSFEFYI